MDFEHPYKVLLNSWQRSSLAIEDCLPIHHIRKELYNIFGEMRHDFVEFYSVVGGLSSGVYDDNLFTVFPIINLFREGDYICFSDRGIGISMFYAQIGNERIYRLSKEVENSMILTAPTLVDFIQKIVLNDSSVE